MPVKVADR